MNIEKNLYQAVHDDDLEVVKQIFSKLPQSIHEFVMKKTYLHVAAQNNSVKVAELLISMGLEPNIKMKDKPETPLEIAAYQNAIDVAKILIHNGADIEGGSKNCTPLISAIIGGHQEMVKLLVENGANVNVQFTNYEQPMNALQVAEYWRHNEIVNYLKKSLNKKTDENNETFTTDNFTQHIEKNLGTVSNLSLRQLIGTVSILVVKSDNNNKPLTLITKIFNNEAEFWHKRQFMLKLPANWPLDDKSLQSDKYYWPIRWLLKIAEYPFDKADLSEFPIIIENENPPKVISEFVSFTSLLIIKEPTQLGELIVKNGEKIEFFTVFPLFTEEMKFEKNNGIIPLLEKMQSKKIGTVIDIKRKSVV
jgi:hypothetical protein